MVVSDASLRGRKDGVNLSGVKPNAGVVACLAITYSLHNYSTAYRTLLIGSKQTSAVIMLG